MLSDIWIHFLSFEKDNFAFYFMQIASIDSSESDLLSSPFCFIVLLLNEEILERNLRVLRLLYAEFDS